LGRPITGRCEKEVPKVKVLVTFIVVFIALVITAAAAAHNVGDRSNVIVPNPQHHNIKTKRMYACNSRPAKWTRTELECVVRIGFGSEAPNARRIAGCESVWTVTAVSHTDDHGLFQINRRWNGEGWRKGANIYDPVWNTRIAYYFWQTRGWGDWVCSRMMGVS